MFGSKSFSPRCLVGVVGAVVVVVVGGGVVGVGVVRIVVVFSGLVALEAACRWNTLRRSSLTKTSSPPSTKLLKKDWTSLERSPGTEM